MKIKLTTSDQETETLKFCAGMVVNNVIHDYTVKGNRYTVLEVEKPPSTKDFLKSHIAQMDEFIDESRKINDPVGLLQYQYRKAELQQQLTDLENGNQ